MFAFLLSHALLKHQPVYGNAVLCLDESGLFVVVNELALGAGNHSTVKPGECMEWEGGSWLGSGRVDWGVRTSVCTMLTRRERSSLTQL